LGLLVGGVLGVWGGCANGVEILVYTRPGRSAAPLLADARRSLAEIARLVGPYPWPRFIVVGSPGGYPMEGPGTIWIPPAVAPSNLRYIVAHETAHQWAPGLVGNDQWADPFADEALADMIARFTTDLHRSSRCATKRLDLPITQYSDACYYEQIYIQGGNWLNTLRTRMGDARYWAALRTYLAAHRFGLAGSRQLLDTLDAATPLDIAALARPLFPSRF
jgi:aminopeptidase N